MRALAMAIGNAIELQRGLGGLSTLPIRDKSDRTEAVEAVEAVGSEVVDLDQQSVMVNRVSKIVIRHVSFGRLTD
jgi:hypothetical protein